MPHPRADIAHTGYPTDGPGEYFNGNNLGLGGAGGVPGIHKGKNTYGTGPTDTNTTVNYQLLQDTRNGELERNDLQHESLLFIRTFKAGGQERIRTATYPMMGLSALNRELMTNPEWRQMYGSSKTFSGFMSEWAMMGTQVGVEPAGYSSGNAYYATSRVFTVAMQSRMLNIWAMLNAGGVPRGPVTAGDVLCLVAQRKEYKPEIEQQLGVVSGSHAMKRIRLAEKSHKEYYWRLLPYVGRNGQPPPVDVYIQPDIVDPSDCKKVLHEGYIGTVIHVGKVWDLQGNCKPSEQARITARAFLMPGDKSNQYKYEVGKMSHVIVTLGQC